MTQSDVNGAGAAPVFNLTTSDVITVDSSGNRTETVTDTNADGSYLTNVLIKIVDGYPNRAIDQRLPQAYRPSLLKAAA